MKSEYIDRATYSPDDNKLRLYPSARLPKELYDQVRAAGFIFAPKQDLFVAPMWTPARADLAEQLAGEIEDDDVSLVERAEGRADRFEGYADRREGEAASAAAQVSRLADNIPFGQPILVGHHSERRARRDQEKIRDGMARAVRLWETSKYWESRAAGAMASAKYKERPDVRARRIKSIEADKRKREKSRQENADFLQLWENPSKELTLERAVAIANRDYISRKFSLAEYPRPADASQYEGDMSLYSALTGRIINAEQARAIAVRCHQLWLANCERWIQHYDFRLAYEKAMLADTGGEPADKWAHIVVGGRVLARGEWVTVMRVTRRNGRLLSVTTNSKYVSVRAADKIQAYEPPAPGEGEKLQAAMKRPPLCNYPGDGFLHMTAAEYEAGLPRFSGFDKIGLIRASASFAAHRVRQTRKPGGQYFETVAVFLTDQKTKEPPASVDAVLPDVEQPRQDINELPRRGEDPQPTVFDAMRESLRAGVSVIVAPQLFPTPPELAARMIEAADIAADHRVLEPSAGTGNLLKAIGDAPDKVAVEINGDLVRALTHCGVSGLHIHHEDFLKCNGNLGLFDRVVMNPPFESGADIDHIKHALHFLKDGGRLVALCANGPRQARELMPLADTWEDLPAGSFKAAGTNVNVAFLIINK
jgi:hypothetical protein